MKKLFLIITVALVAWACGNNQQSAQQTQQETTVSTGNFGAAITADSAVSVDELKNLMGDKTEINVKLSGTVDAVCQGEGCWLNLKTADGNKLHIVFKDEFVVPKDAAGKQAIVQGVAKIEEPTHELVFEAEGVIIQ